MPIIGRVTLQTRMLAVYVGDVVSNLFESNAAGHCAMTNADEANDVQENVVAAKKEKKRGTKGITSFLVNNPSVVIQNADSFSFTTRVGGNMSRGISRGEYYYLVIFLCLYW